MLSPRFGWRRRFRGAFEMLGRDVSSAGVMGDKGAATVVAGVAYAVSVELTLENVETEDREALLRAWWMGKPPMSLESSW
jgi:hypothetical protein